MWACSEALLSRRRGGNGIPHTEPESEPGETGEFRGDSGNDMSSGEMKSGNGPLRALAGETGRLPGIGSSFIAALGFVTNGLTNWSSTADVSQFSKPSPLQEISRELSRLEMKLGDSRSVGVWH